MAAAILTVLISFLIAGVVWLTLGARFRLAEEDEQNGVRNLFVYFLGLVPVVFTIVFFLIERL